MEKVRHSMTVRSKRLKPTPVQEKLIRVIRTAAPNIVELKKLLTGLEGDLQKLNEPIHRKYSAAIERISHFLKRYRASLFIRDHLATIAFAFSDHADGRRVPLFVGKSQRGRQKITTLTWRLRARAALCVWLLEKSEGSEEAAAVEMAKRQPNLKALKSRPSDNLHKVLAAWCRQFAAGEGNEDAAKFFKAEKARIEKNGPLSKSEAHERGLKKLADLSKKLADLSESIQTLRPAITKQDEGAIGPATKL
jgi:hypothetical protein